MTLWLKIEVKKLRLGFISTFPCPTGSERITRIWSEPSRSDQNPLGSTQIPSGSEQIPSGFIIILFLINYFIVYINHYTLYKYKYRYKYKNRQYLQLKKKSVNVVMDLSGWWIMSRWRVRLCGGGDVASCVDSCQ